MSPDADAVRQTSEDGWSCGTPLSALTDDRDAMLAIAMNGEPLPLEHGPGAHGGARPLRVRVRDQVGGGPRGDAVRQVRAYWTERAGPSEDR